MGRERLAGCFSTVMHSAWTPVVLSAAIAGWIYKSFWGSWSTRRKLVADPLPEGSELPCGLVFLVLFMLGALCAYISGMLCAHAYELPEEEYDIENPKVAE